MIFFNVSRYILLFFMVIFLLSLSPDVVSAGISGEASLKYSNYSVRDDLGGHLSAYSFTQDYSLLYSSKGYIYNSRVGKYEVSLGYNWSALDTHATSTTGDDSYAAKRGHVFFGGEVLVDPKEMPLRFNAYSRDLMRNSYTSTASAETYSLFSRNNGPLLGETGFSTGINDGMHITSGATLIAGVKNGMTNGYNEVLRHLPMIMLDYRDDLNRDLRSITPIDTRLSQLAFVSLNKKDNWFHYRYITFNDHINPTNDYLETQIQIGTIDQKLARRWIDFSNWIQVSADLQLTENKSSQLSRHYDEIDMNVFTQVRRSNWEARNYNNFNRYADSTGNLTYRTSIPINVSATLSPDTSWATRTSYRENSNNIGGYMQNLLAGYKLDMFKRSPFVLNHSFDVESSRTEGAGILTFAALIETASTRLFSNKYNLAASYSIKNSNDSTSSNDNNFLEQKLALRADYSPSNGIRFVLRQENEFANGSSINFATNVKDASTSLPQYVSPRTGLENLNGSSGGSYRSLTNFLTYWQPLPRLNFSLSATEDIYSSDASGKSYITAASMSADYSVAKAKLSNSLTFMNGSYQIGEDTTSFSANSSLGYFHNRSLNSNFIFGYNRWTDNKLKTYSFDAEQRLTYTYFSYSGITRKLFELDEMLSYSNSPYLTQSIYSANYSTITNSSGLTSALNDYTNAKRSERASLSIGGKYYPRREFTLSSGARYQYDDAFKNYSLVWYSSIGANFRLVQASLDYYQGRRHSDGLLEKKFSANMKKTF